MDKRGVSDIIVVVLLIIIIILAVLILREFVMLSITSQSEVSEVMNGLAGENVDILGVEGNLTSPDSLNITFRRGMGKMILTNSTIIAGKYQSVKIILATDTSGSMEWCANKNEISSGWALWEDNNRVFCSDRTYLSSNICAQSKISGIRNAMKTFISELFKANLNSEVGIVEYSSGNDVKKTDMPDLAPSLYIGANPDCFISDWFDKDFDDSSWKDYALADKTCKECKLFFRKKFSISDISKIKLVELNLTYDEGIVCFINGKEIFYYPRGAGKSSIKILANVFNEGDNTLACSVSNGITGGWNFTAKLATNMGTLISQDPSGWKYNQSINCYNTLDPKYIRARRNAETNFTILVTIKNKGVAINIPFNVSFYKSSFAASNLIGKVTINNLGAQGVTQARLNWNSTISGSSLIFYVKADNESVIAESNESDNAINMAIYAYDYFDKDLLINTFSYSPDKCSLSDTNYIFNAEIQNVGSKDITENFNVTFYKNISGSITPLVSVRVSGLNATVRRVVVSPTWSGNLPKYASVFAYVDSNNEVNEENETNNQYALKVLPDLIPNKIMLDNGPVCNLGVQSINITVNVTNYYCQSDPSDVVLSFTRYNYSVWQPIPSLDTGEQVSRNFTLIKDIISYTPYPAYGYADRNTTNVTERSESNNENTFYVYVGPDILFSSFKVIPNNTIENSYKTFKLNATIKNAQCSVGIFNISFYKNIVSSENLIGKEQVTLTGTIPKTITYDWTVSLSDNTNVIAVLDSDNNVAEYSESNNQASALITVEPLAQFSIIPFFDFSKISVSFLEIMGITDSCSGNNESMYADSIVRTMELTNDSSSLNSFIDKTETWWGTCMCCGINKAIKMLDVTADAKIIVLMGDGVANQTCSEQGSGDPVTDAVLAAQNAFKRGIIVHTVGFGEDVDKTSMKNIAKNGSGNYYDSSNVSNIAQIYKEIAGGIIEEYGDSVKFAHMKVIFYNDSAYYVEKIPFDDLLKPIETRKYTFPLNETVAGKLSDHITNIKRIKIYLVGMTRSGREVIGPLLDTWEAKN